MTSRELLAHVVLRGAVVVAATVPVVMWQVTPVPMLEEPNHLHRAPLLGLVLVCLAVVSRRWATRVPLLVMAALWLLYLLVARTYAPWAGDVGGGAGMMFLPPFAAVGTALCVLVPFRDPDASKGSWPPAD